MGIKKTTKKERRRCAARRRKGRASDVQVVHVRFGRNPACPHDRMYPSAVDYVMQNVHKPAYSIVKCVVKLFLSTNREASPLKVFALGQKVTK